MPKAVTLRAPGLHGLIRGDFQPYLCPSAPKAEM